MNVLKNVALVGLLLCSCDTGSKEDASEAAGGETTGEGQPDDDVSPAKLCNQSELKPADYDGVRTYWVGSKEFTLAFCFRLATDCTFNIKTAYYMSSLGQWFTEQGKGVAVYKEQVNQYKLSFDSDEDDSPTEYSNTMLVGPEVDEEGPFFYGQHSTTSVMVDGAPAVGEAAFWETAEECGLAQ